MDLLEKNKHERERTHHVKIYSDPETQETASGVCRDLGQGWDLAFPENHLMHDRLSHLVKESTKLDTYLTPLKQMKSTWKWSSLSAEFNGLYWTPYTYFQHCSKILLYAV